MIFSDKHKDFLNLISAWFPSGFFYAVLFLLIILTYFIGSVGLLLAVLPFLLATGFIFIFIPIVFKKHDNTDLFLLTKELNKKKQVSLYELSEKLGFSIKKIEKMLYGLTNLGLYTFAYYKPDKILYIFEPGHDMLHCPRCASDFIDKSGGKCPGCNMIYSRVLVRKPFYYL